MVRTVKVRLPDELYMALVQRYGVRGLSRGVTQLLQQALSLSAQSAAPPAQAGAARGRAEEDAGKATERQLSYIRSFLARWGADWALVRELLAHELGIVFPDRLEDLEKHDASAIIDYLKDWDQPAAEGEAAEAARLSLKLPEHARKLLEGMAAKEVRKFHVALVNYLASQQ